MVKMEWIVLNDDIVIFLNQGLGEVFGFYCGCFFPTQEEHWPLLLSLVAVPTMVQLILLPWFPESPRYLLIERGDVHATIAG